MFSAPSKDIVDALTLSISFIFLIFFILIPGPPLMITASFRMSSFSFIKSPAACAIAIVPLSANQSQNKLFLLSLRCRTISSCSAFLQALYVLNSSAHIVALFSP